MAIPTEEWLTVTEACIYLKIGRATLYRWAREGRLNLHKVGIRTTRISLTELQHLLDVDDDRAWTALSEAVFAKDWDNEKDAIYDNWREIYGVPER